jgi:hypothetical protein
VNSDITKVPTRSTRAIHHLLWHPSTYYLSTMTNATNNSNGEEDGNSRESKRPRRSELSKQGDDMNVTAAIDQQQLTGIDVESLNHTTHEDDLRQIAAEATVVEFDSRTGRPLNHEHFLPHGTLDPIRGIVKKKLPPELFCKLKKIHEHIQQQVDATHRIPWAGINDGDTKVRAFGFLGQAALHRLDHHSSVRLRAPEKEGQDAEDDEAANRQAICVLDMEDSQLDVRGTTDQFVEALDPSAAKLDPHTVSTEELIAYQINMHNGARYLPAHLDWPLHEGFGKVIATVAIRGDATVLLIGGDMVVVGGEEVQPAWRFHLEQGECYVLSDGARNRCLHAVVTNEDDKARESLNLRFGLHTEKEAERLITRFWKDEL